MGKRGSVGLGTPAFYLAEKGRWKQTTTRLFYDLALSDILRATPVEGELYNSVRMSCIRPLWRPISLIGGAWQHKPPKMGYYGHHVTTWAPKLGKIIVKSAQN